MILNGVTQTQKDRHCMFSFIGSSWLRIVRSEVTTWSNFKEGKTLLGYQGIIKREITGKNDLEEETEKLYNYGKGKT